MVDKKFVVNAFATERFLGNPACVVVLEGEMETGKMLQIAKENALPETAFILPKGGDLILRWFTPDIEMDLCGHATLASAYIALKYIIPGDNVVKFKTCEGDIFVERCGDDMLTLNFPVRMPVEAKLPQEICNSLSIKPLKVYKSRDYVLVYNSPDDILKIEVSDRELFDSINLDPGGVIVTAAGGEIEGKSYDFVSRFFTPQSTILEDPVTGSAHCSLVPYWSGVLRRNVLVAAQLSERRGELHCELKDGRVYLSGRCIE